MTASVAIIGGGPAGAMCAHTLLESGHAVVVFDKARGAGGRTSTRRHETLRFDHGAQYLTARNPELRAHFDQWLQLGVLAEWEGTFGSYRSGQFEVHSPSTARLVAKPSMNALVKHLLETVPVRFSHRIQALVPGGTGWFLESDEHKRGPFAAVVVAVPAPQARLLLDAHPFARKLEEATISPCWTAMATAPNASVPWVGCHVEDHPLGWIARNQTKPGRSGGEQWVLQASASWSAQHLERDPSWVLRTLVDEASSLTGVELTGLQAHRWRYAQVTQPLETPCLFDAATGLGVCGDALLGGRVEDALASGAAMAHRLHAHLGDPIPRATP